MSIFTYKKSTVFTFFAVCIAFIIPMQAWSLCVFEPNHSSVKACIGLGESDSANRQAIENRMWGDAHSPSTERAYLCLAKGKPPAYVQRAPIVKGAHFSVYQSNNQALLCPSFGKTECKSHPVCIWVQESLSKKESEMKIHDGKKRKDMDRLIDTDALGHSPTK